MDTVIIQTKCTFLPYDVWLTELWIAKGMFCKGCKNNHDTLWKPLAFQILLSFTANLHQLQSNRKQVLVYVFTFILNCYYMVCIKRMDKGPPLEKLKSIRLLIQMTADWKHKTPVAEMPALSIKLLLTKDTGELHDLKCRSTGVLAGRCDLEGWRNQIRGSSQNTKTFLCCWNLKNLKDRTLPNFCC